MKLIKILVATLVLTAFAPLHAREWQAPATTGVIGVETAQLDPQYWIARQPDADKMVLNTAMIAKQNARLHALDKSLYDLDALPASLPREQVAEWVGLLSAPPKKPLFDERGQPLSATTVGTIVDNANIDAIPATRDTRYGLVVHRAALRAFPTMQRVFTSPDDHDIDRFQESALFPGDPVAIAHESRDGAWWFVVSPRYAAWVEKRFVAVGTKDAVLGYARKAPHRVVTGAEVHTVFTPEEPDVSELQLDMGVRVPVLANWPPADAVNGQHHYASHVIELPVRNEDGSLRFAPALLPRRESTSAD